MRATPNDRAFSQVASCRTHLGAVEPYTALEPVHDHDLGKTLLESADPELVAPVLVFDPGVEFTRRSTGTSAAAPATSATTKQCARWCWRRRAW